MLTILQELQTFVHSLIVRYHGTHNDIRVTVHVLRQRVHDDVRAQIKWALQVRRQERVVHNHHDLEEKK